MVLFQLSGFFCKAKGRGFKGNPKSPIAKRCGGRLPNKASSNFLIRAS